MPLSDLVPAKCGEIEDGAKKALLTSDAQMGIGIGGKGIRAWVRYTLAC
jgi:hypothetical protein